MDATLFEIELEKRGTEENKTHYKGFKEIQNDVWKTLDIVVDICENANISYQLAFGSLLGAVRDKGQIPWDYDVDLFIPYSSKEQLEKELDQHLSADYYYVTCNRWGGLPGNMMRIAPKKYSFSYVHVDIFFLVGTPRDPYERDKFLTNIEKLTNGRYWKMARLFRGSSNKKEIISLAWKKICHSLFPIAKGYDKLAELCRMYDLKEAKYCIVPGRRCKVRVYPTSVLETIEVCLKGKNYRITKEYEYVLDYEYGDYMKNPDFDKCVMEFERHYKNIIEKGMKR